MGRHLVPPLATVLLNHVPRVDGQALVGVHHHAEETRVCLSTMNHNQCLTCIFVVTFDSGRHPQAGTKPRDSRNSRKMAIFSFCRAQIRPGHQTEMVQRK